ncbi:cell division control protein 2 homolog [Cornus florida]|uniref:cell division control protein 2 homolog n=1 Tax=Cornus florida TaxID=4283 RepID=UPI00289A2602|nr:cell division control protein 2 homolog [Cornus florida]
MEKYEKLEQIGSGVSSIVYKALNRETNEIVCLKEIKDLGPESEEIPCFVIRECSFLKEMEHDNIIRLLDVAVNLEIGKAYMVFEYMEFDLKKFMETHLEIAKDPQFIKRFLHQILSGLAYCHSHKIIHRDLKPMNLLVDIHGRILKLADFGLAKAVDVPRQSYTGGSLVH